MNKFKKLVLLVGVAATSVVSSIYADEKAQIESEQISSQQMQNQGDETLDVIKERRLNFAKRALGRYVSRRAKGRITPLIRTCFTAMMDSAVPRQASDIPYADALEWAIPEILASYPGICCAATRTGASQNLGLTLLKKAVSKNTDANTPWFKKASAVLIASLQEGVFNGDNFNKIGSSHTKMIERDRALQNVLDLKRGISKYFARWIKDRWIKNAVGKEVEQTDMKIASRVQFTKLMTRVLTRCALKPMLYYGLNRVEQAVRKTCNFNPKSE